MPCLGIDDYKEHCERVRKLKAKLIAKGIDPRSMKFLKLLHRR